MSTLPPAGRPGAPSLCTPGTEMWYPTPPAAPVTSPPAERAELWQESRREFWSSVRSCDSYKNINMTSDVKLISRESSNKMLPPPFSFFKTLTCKTKKIQMCLTLCHGAGWCLSSPFKTQTQRPEILLTYFLIKYAVFSVKGKTTWALL